MPAATVTVVPGSAVPLKATARRALSTPCSGAVSASLGAEVSTSNCQLLLTVRAKTLLLLKLTLTEWVPSESFVGATIARRPSSLRASAVASSPSTVTLSPPSRSPAGTATVIVGF